MFMFISHIACKNYNCIFYVGIFLIFRNYWHLMLINFTLCCNSYVKVNGKLNDCNNNFIQPKFFRAHMHATIGTLLKIIPPDQSAWIMWMHCVIWRVRTLIWGVRYMIWVRRDMGALCDMGALRWYPYVILVFYDKSCWSIDLLLVQHIGY